MLLNYLKLTLRNIGKSKINFFINVFGLAIGLACCILVILFVKNEITYDRFHTQANQIFRPYMTELEEDQTRVNTVTPGPLGPLGLSEIPEIKEYVIIGQFTDLVKKGNEPIQERAFTASSSFFRVFSFKILDGSVEGIFEGPNDVVLTKSMATKYFGNDDPIGKTLSMHIGDDFRDMVVKAVTEDSPSNSSIQYNFLVSEENNKYLFPERMLRSWFAMFSETYFLLEEGADQATVEAKFVPVMEEIFGERSAQRSYDIKLQPLTDIHLNTDLPAGIAQVSDPKYSYILASVAFVILLVACVNFMNLSIGLSISRAKEIGMRKVMGAEKRQLIFQFLSESMTLAVIGVSFGILLAFALLPTFNDLAGTSLTLDFSLMNVALLLGIMLLVGLGAGFYPALVLSSFKPLNILRGNASLGIGKQHLRKAMMILQFVFSIFLIATTLIMSRQLSFLSNKNLGFDKENLVIVQGASTGRGIRDMIKKGMEQSELYRNQLISNPDITGVSVSSFTPGNGGWLQIGYRDEGETRNFQVNIVKDGYVEVSGMELAAGRAFSRDIATDAQSAIVVNEAFVRDFGLENPVGKKIPGGQFGNHQIIGVVKDFNFESLHTQVVPVVLTMNADFIFSGAQEIGISSRPNPNYSVRIKPGKLSETIKYLETTWQRLYPGTPFDFEFLDERLAAQYEQEENLGEIITTAAVLAIIIGCLGLFALSKLSIESRSKEIGIRKVLGASYQTILYSFSKGYGVLIIIAFLIAIPLSFYLAKEWLTTFEYTIALNGLEFALAGLATMVIAIITLSFHSVKVARANPALTLRDE